MTKNLRIKYAKLVIGQNRSRAAGFTILEMMIASAVFAVVLLIVAIGAISFTDSYYSGITSSEVQSDARAIMLQVSQSLEFSENFTPLNTTASGVAGYCIGSTMYSYQLGTEVLNSPSSQDQNYHGLVEDTSSTCSSSTPPNLPETPPSTPLPSSQHELLNQHMRLTAFDITLLSNNLYTVHIKVVYGDNVILETQTPPLPGLGNSQWSTVGCASGSGSQFCAVSDLTTAVEQRLN